ncbi:MAG: GDP-mannose 4,6-dehydratase [Acidimicrobiales bacterium]
MRVFVTGGHGFVGPWLTRHLAERGDEVVVADPAVDVTNPAALRPAVEAARPEVVYHLAAQASVASSWDAPAEVFAVNALGTVHLLGAVRDCAPGARVVLVSSVEVYGVVPAAELPLTEDCPFRPATPYAASKAAAELAGLQAHLGWGLDVVRVRPFNHTGPGQADRFFAPAMARQIVEGQRRGVTELLTGNLEVRRDLLDVRDVVRAYRLLAENGAAGDVYNVCTGTSVALTDVVQQLVSLVGWPMVVRTDPARLRPVDLPDLRGDPARLVQATGWQPEFGLGETLRDVVEYWRRCPAA